MSTARPALSRASMTVNVRVHPKDSIDAAKKHMESLLADLPVEVDADGEATTEDAVEKKEDES